MDEKLQDPESCSISETTIQLKDISVDDNNKGETPMKTDAERSDVDNEVKKIPLIAPQQSYYFDPNRPAHNATSPYQQQVAGQPVYIQVYTFVRNYYLLGKVHR